MTDPPGKPLPFPVLINGDGKTSGIYGIRVWPTALLTDPSGHLVKFGNAATLAEKLGEISAQRGMQMSWGISHPG